jgi:hypothetical protein
MMFSKKNTLRMTALLASIFLCQCSKEGISADFHVSVVPEKPLIHEVGRTIDGGAEIQPDWFLAKFNINNQTGHNIKIEEIVLRIQQEGDDPPMHSPDLGTATETCGDESYNYVDYCVYPDGYNGPWATCLADATDATQGFYHDNSSDTTGPNIARHCDATDDTPQFNIHYVLPITEGVYFHGITPSDENQSASKVYNVQVEMKGIVMDGTTEKDRFTKRMYFNTR